MKHRVNTQGFNIAAWRGSQHAYVNKDVTIEAGIRPFPGLKTCPSVVCLNNISPVKSNTHV